MPDYREIYNHVVQHDARYNLAENSPGFRAVVGAADRLSLLSGRALDVGCGVGFAAEFMSGPIFDFHVFGVDVSDVAIEQAKKRLEHIPGSAQRLLTVTDQTLPFDADFFNLITCFDVLEHLDEPDIDVLLAEMLRTARPGGVLYISVSCRASGVSDLHGDNLHRTVRGTDWWIEKVQPDTAEYDGHRMQLALWKHVSLTPANPTNSKRNMAALQFQNAGQSSTTAVPGPAAPPDSLEHHPKDSASLYQQIYDDNPWYGNADQGRCPGVRLLPEYQDWLISPVLDMGCGRGQTVEQLRSDGYEADGIDQVEIHPGMRVGDITQPLEQMDRYNSVVCI